LNLPGGRRIRSHFTPWDDLINTWQAAEQLDGARGTLHNEVRAKRAEAGREPEELHGVAETVKTTKNHIPAAGVLALPQTVGVRSVAAADCVTLGPRSGEIALHGKYHPTSGSATVGVSSQFLGSVEASERIRQKALL
jgi:hypothetical protein